MSDRRDHSRVGGLSDQELERLSAFVDGELSETEAAEVAASLEDPERRAQVEALAAVDAALIEVADDLEPEDWARIWGESDREDVADVVPLDRWRVVRRWALAAAVLLMAAGSVAVLAVLGDEPPERSATLASEDSGRLAVGTPAEIRPLLATQKARSEGQWIALVVEAGARRMVEPMRTPPLVAQVRTGSSSLTGTETPPEPPTRSRIRRSRRAGSWPASTESGAIPGIMVELEMLGPVESSRQRRERAACWEIEIEGSGYRSRPVILELTVAADGRITEASAREEDPVGRCLSRAVRSLRLRRLEGRERRIEVSLDP